MQLDFHVTPQGSVYAFVLDAQDKPVVVYQRKCTPQRQPMQSTCNERYSRRVFMTEEQPYWEVMGYHFIGRLELPKGDSTEHYRKHLDRIVSCMDALVRRDPLPPVVLSLANRRVLTDAVQFLDETVLDTVLVGTAAPSRYDWSDSTAS